MLAFCRLKKLRVLSYYFGSDLQNFRRTSSSSWNLILSSRKLHDASSTAPLVEKLKLLDYASTRQKEPTIERKQLWISRADTIEEKNISGGLRVLKQMRDANVKLDSYTFSYLIGNSETKEEIKKYYEEMEQSGIHLTKEVFVALLHAYPACGEFDVKKQDVLCNLHGELERLLLILKELSGQDWVDGCRWAIRYSVKHKNLSSTVELFKQLKDYFKSDKFKRHMLFDEAYCLISKYGPTYLQFGLDLLGLIKKELGLVPSRLCLDSLLSGCAKSRDLNNAYLVWREYEFAGYRYDSISYLTMYHALLASGDHKYADIILKKIPRLYFDLCSSLKHSYVKVDEAGKAKASYYKAVNERKGRGHYRGKPYGKDKGKKKDVGGGSKPM